VGAIERLVDLRISQRVLGLRDLLPARRARSAGRLLRYCLCFPIGSWAEPFLGIWRCQPSRSREIVGKRRNSRFRLLASKSLTGDHDWG